MPVNAEDFAFSRLAAYACYQWPGYKLAKHHRMIARHLEAVERGDIKRLMITMPPRHGKSMLASEFFPAWYLGRNPNDYIVIATYAQELADDFGRKVKNQIQDDAYKAIFPGVTLADDSQSSKRFHIDAHQGGYEHQTAQRGAFYAVGVGGPLTGRGAHLLLIDDPVKNREEAESELIRKKTRDWYTSTAYTRLMPGGRIVVIQTRWHENDLAGWLQTEHEHEGWTVLNLPAISVDGLALWPEQYDIEALEQIKRALPPRDWSALYQQAPSPDTGDYFKREWINIVDFMPPIETMSIYGGSDYAVTANGGDYTAHVVVGIDYEGRVWLLDMWRQQASSDRWVEAFCDLVRKWRPIGWAEETGQIKSGVGPFLTKRMIETEAYVAREQFATRGGNKAVRAQSIRGRIALSGLYIHRDAEFTTDLINEMMSFPVGVHDDQCMVGDTPIEVIGHKDKPLKYVQVGDYVITPDGPKKVLAAGKTSDTSQVYDVRMSDGRVITATGNHPVFVKGKGFVRVDALCIMDAVVSAGEIICNEDRRRLKLSNTTAIGIGATHGLSTGITSDISKEQSHVAASFIGIYGKMLTGLYRKVSKSITRMGIGTITNWLTWNAYPLQNIAASTRCLKRDTPSRSSTLPGLMTWQNLGTSQKQAKSFIEPMGVKSGKTSNLSQSSAPSAVKDTKPSLIAQSIAVAPALSVRAIVPRDKREPVYNITVEDCPMYYANGILTHNCDALGLVGQLIDRMDYGAEPFNAGVPLEIGAIYAPELEHYPRRRR